MATPRREKRKEKEQDDVQLSGSCPTLFLLRKYEYFVLGTGIQQSMKKTDKYA